LVISNHSSFRVLFDKIVSVYFVWRIYLYFSIGNGHWPAKGTSTVPITQLYFTSPQNGSKNIVSAHFRSLFTPPDLRDKTLASCRAVWIESATVSEYLLQSEQLVICFLFTVKACVRRKCPTFAARRSTVLVAAELLLIFVPLRDDARPCVIQS